MVAVDPGAGTICGGAGWQPPPERQKKLPSNVTVTALPPLMRQEPLVRTMPPASPGRDAMAICPIYRPSGVYVTVVA
jgi:hypothetical protein